MRYEEKVAVVAGKDTLITAACAKKLLDEGAKVVVYDTDPATFEQLGEYKTKYAESLRTYVVDSYTNVDTLKAAADYVIKEFGTVDVVVTCIREASAKGNLETMPMDLYQKVMDNCFTGVLFTIQPLLKVMIEKEYGRVCIISSLEGRTGFKGANFALACANAGLGGIIRNIATTCGKVSIVANGVATGPIAGDPEYDGYENMYGIIPGREKVTPEAVADGMMYVSDGFAAWNTGEILDMSTGKLMV